MFDSFFILEFWGSYSKIVGLNLTYVNAQMIWKSLLPSLLTLWKTVQTISPPTGFSVYCFVGKVILFNDDFSSCLFCFSPYQCYYYSAVYQPESMDWDGVKINCKSDCLAKFQCFYDKLWQYILVKFQLPQREACKAMYGLDCIYTQKTVIVQCHSVDLFQSCLLISEVFAPY